MKTNPKSGLRWFVLFIIVGLVAMGGYYVLTQTNLLARLPMLQTGQSTTNAVTTLAATVAIQPADLAQSAASAAGNLALVSERSVALAVDGVVEKIAVKVGDRVKAGDVL